MNNAHSSHKSYISNPAEVIRHASRKLFDNLGIVAAHFGISIAVVLGFGLVFGLSFVPLIADRRLVLVPFIIGLLLIFPFMYAVTWLGLVGKRISLALLEGHKPVFKNVFANDTKKTFGLLGLNILISLAVFGGYLFLIIPGIILMLMFSYAPFIYVKKDISVVDAMGQSFELVKTSFLELLGVSSVFLLYRGISYGISNIPLIGFLFAVVFIPIDIFVAYLQDVAVGYRYTSLESKVPRPAKAHVLNWVFISLVVGLVVVVSFLFIFVIIYMMINDNTFTNLLQNYTAIIG